MILRTSRYRSDAQDSQNSFDIYITRINSLMWEDHPDDFANNVKHVELGMEQMESKELRMACNKSNILEIQTLKNLTIRYLFWKYINYYR